MSNKEPHPPTGPDNGPKPTPPDKTLSQADMEFMAKKAEITQAEEDFMRSFMRKLAMESANPEDDHVLNTARELETFVDQIELQAMLTDSPESELAVESDKIVEQIEDTVFSKTGIRGLEVKDWLASPWFYSKGEDEESGTSFKLEASPQGEEHTTFWVTVNKRGERLSYCSDNFHGSGSHRLKYTLKLGESAKGAEGTSDAGEKYIAIDADYMTSRDGTIKFGRAERISLMRGNKNRFPLSKNYHGQEAVALSAWLDHKAAALLEEVRVDETNSRLVADDLKTRYTGRYTERKKVEDLNLEAQHRIILADREEAIRKEEAGRKQ